MMDLDNGIAALLHILKECHTEENVVLHHAFAKKKKKKKNLACSFLNGNDSSNA